MKLSEKEVEKIKRVRARMNIPSFTIHLDNNQDCIKFHRQKNGRNAGSICFADNNTDFWLDFLAAIRAKKVAVVEGL